MKTRTYASLALLLPLIIWVIFLLVELLINAVIPADLRPNGPSTFFGLLEVTLLYYVIGILIWFLPYLVLSLALLLISFRSRLETLKSLYILSPFLMAMLVMLEVTIISLAAGGLAVPSVDLVSSFKDIAAINLMVGILGLVWGYICVGLGLGGYRLLQRFGRIKDAEKTDFEPINLNSQLA